MIKHKKYEGGCLCGETTYVAESDPINPHLCSCTMCQKSSGAPTVAWVSFTLKGFKWNGKNEPGLYQSSEGVQRCFCKNCGGALATLEDGSEDICITIASLNNPNLILPDEQQHSYSDSKPLWWEVRISLNN